ncbi:hypothetical protein GYMLUDRAFT_254665 [Collybiopsis luxurians FD-317 M1]|nr:hypothetical protein GYMLUDRAFT_254665 [Collybiopsis luxurians FD-317 M1]
MQFKLSSFAALAVIVTASFASPVPRPDISRRGNEYGRGNGNGVSVTSGTDAGVQGSSGNWGSGSHGSSGDSWGSGSPGSGGNTWGSGSGSSGNSGSTWGSGSGSGSHGTGGDSWGSDSGSYGSGEDSWGSGSHGSDGDSWGSGSHGSDGDNWGSGSGSQGNDGGLLDLNGNSCPLGWILNELGVCCEPGSEGNSDSGSGLLGKIGL